jgi:glutamyl/glutaminyl-tRNA synthetase
MNLYEALELEHPMFATVPHILGESGTKKLGKRDGAKDVLEYIKEGYIVEALVNFIASLGWNDGTEQEIFTRDELVKKFSLDRVQRSGARFDEKRLLWMNGQWIRKLSVDDLYERATDFWPKSVDQASIESKKQVLSLVQDRLKTLADIPLLTSYFFEEPVPDWNMVYDNKQLSKLSRDEVKSLLKSAQTALSNSEYNAESLQNTLNLLLETTGQKPGILFSLIRLAVSWAPFSPALNDTLAVLGHDKVQLRLQLAIETA